MTDELLHPAATKHLPAFITAPGETDVLMVVIEHHSGALHSVVRQLVLSVAHPAGAHGAQISQAAVRDRRRPGPSCPLHPHPSFLGGGSAARDVDIPDFGARSLSRIAGSTEKLAGLEPGQGAWMRRAGQLLKIRETTA